jgi:tetratricopeptide (TPR) repeat protein
MKKLYFFILFLFPLFSAGQTKHGLTLIDSLQKKLLSAAEDTNKVKLLDLISFTYSNIKPDEGIKYGNKARELARKLGWNRGIALAYADLGVNYAAKSDHSNAIDHYQQALKLYEELNDQNGAASVMANISLVYMSQSNYPKALEYAFKALGGKEEHLNKRTAAIIRENIGTIYLEQKKYSETMQYYTKALKAYEELGDKKSVARNLGNTGIVQDALGNYEKALESHFLALKVNQELKDENSIQINLANVGYVYCHLKNFNKALEYQEEALKISEKLGLKGSIAVNTGNIGETYFAIANDTSGNARHQGFSGKGKKKESLKQSIKYLEKAVNLCKEINYAGPQIEFSQYLSDAYFLSGNYKKAFEAFKDYAIVKESVFSQQSKIDLAKLESQRELDLKDKDIIIKNKEEDIVKLDALNKRNERVIYISGIVLLIITTTIIIRRYVVRHRRHKTALADIAQIQAHEIRGPVATLQGLVKLFNHNNPSDPINGELLRYIFDATIELDKKVKTVVDKTVSA